MSQILHFARLEQPSQALRTECGSLREAANWTTVRTLVNCPRCRELIGEAPPSPERVAGATGTDR